MNILALDLGTDTGYVAGDTESNQFIVGTWKLATKKEITQWGKQRLTRRRDPRPGRLCGFITSQILCSSKYSPDIIVFEDVQFSSSTYQTQLWSALRTSVWMCLNDVVKFECVSVKTLKAFACHGGADKAAMRDALNIKHPEMHGEEMSDDEVDATWIWLWAKQNLSRTPSENGWLKQVLDTNRSRQRMKI